MDRGDRDLIRRDDDLQAADIAADRAAAGCWSLPSAAALAFYHVGVEQHWFAGPSACTAAAGTPTTLEALKAQLLHQQPVRCDEPAWSLFGISLAGWNLLASLAMAGICLVMFFQLRGTGRRGIGRRIA